MYSGVFTARVGEHVQRVRDMSMLYSSIRRGDGLPVGVGIFRIRRRERSAPST